MIFLRNFLLGHVIIICDTPQEPLESLLEYQNIEIIIQSNFNYATHATNKLCAFGNIKCFGNF